MERSLCTVYGAFSNQLIPDIGKYFKERETGSKSLSSILRLSLG